MRSPASRLLRGIAAVAMLSTSLLTSPAPADATTAVAFNPTDDATVRESAPSTNYGNRTTLEVDASSRKDILMKFDVTGVGSLTVVSATLRLHAVDSSPVGGTFTATSDTSWTESSVTWSSAPAGDGAVLGTLGSVSAGNWYELDLTGAVTGDGPLSIRVASTSSNGADYSSSEDGPNPPQLDLILLDTSGDTESPTAPTGLAVVEARPSSVSLSWNAATDNVGVTGYDVYRDGALVDSIGAVTAYQDVTVTSERSYDYHVVARDAAGNLSGPSNTVTAVTPPSGPDTIYDVWRDGNTYNAVSQGGVAAYSGSLKSVVERALDDLRVAGSGSILFGPGDFDLGSEHFEIDGITDVVFAGQGMGVTTIRNFTNEAADTEPFDAVRSDRLVIRDMTVSAGGSERTTSDALDFDGGDDILIERVEITAARGRGIVFDGKDSVASTGGTAERNTVRDCVIRNTPRDGIQLLSSNHNTIERCDISGAGANGIRVHLSSSSAAQPLKPSNDNHIADNIITNSAESGISVTGGSRNTLIGNTLTNNVGDGARIYTSTSSLFCDDNVVDQNTITDNGRYGISIDNSNCRRTVIGVNVLSGNPAGAINDNGTDTIYTNGDTEPPSPPTGLTATAVSASAVTLSWTGSTDNVGVVAYDIYRDGAPIGSAGVETNYTDTTVAAVTAYSYHVVARDAVGNMSAPSNTVNVTTPEQPPVITLAPTDDAHVRESAPTRNYGSRSSIEVDDNSRKDILLRFDVSGLSEKSVVSATLRLYNTDSSNQGGIFTATTDTSWSEDTVTWNSAPAADGIALGSLGPVERNNWYEVDVTPLITGDGPVSVRVTSPSSNGADYSSTENANGNGPELVIVIQP